MTISVSRRIGVAILAVLVTSFPASADETCGFDVCWGAVAVGNGNTVARAKNLQTAPAAWDRAQSVCLGNCDKVEVFHSGCGAIVSTPGGDTFAGFAANIKGAMLEATLNCEAMDNTRCDLRVWECSGVPTQAIAADTRRRALDVTQPHVVLLTHGETQEENPDIQPATATVSVAVDDAGSSDLWGHNPFGSAALRAD